MKGRIVKPGEKDKRIAYGARCTWWGKIQEVGNRDGLPCCPKCGNMLFEMENEAEFFKGAKEYDKDHPGYLDYLKWSKGKCFQSITEGQRAFTTENPAKSQEEESRGQK